MDYLGALPLNLSIRVNADNGRPSVVSDPGWRDRRSVQVGRAAGGGQDRTAGQGFLVEVSDDLDFEGHLMS